jgi:endoplasmic reticulum-Golgi intermediate compartment protein 3
LSVTVLSLDVADISGETQRDISHNILKKRLDEHSVPIPSGHSAELRNDLDKLNEAKQEGYCGSCYGGELPESGCCNTCDQVRESYLQRGWSFNNPEAIDQVSVVSAV